MKEGLSVCRASAADEGWEGTSESILFAPQGPMRRKDTGRRTRVSGS